MLRFEPIVEILRVLREERARTTTTLLGLVWGTFAVVSLLAFGGGLESHVKRKADALGRGIVVAWPSLTTLPFEGLARGRPILLTRKDVLALGRKVPEMGLVSPEFITQERVQVGARIHRTTVSGVHPAYAELRSWRLEPGGRFLDDRDIEERRRVVVLGNRVKEAVFGAGPAVGRTVRLRGVPFTVVGVLAPKLQDSNYHGEDASRACIPATTHEEVLGQRYVETFVFRARSPDVHAAAIERLYRTLGREKRFDARDRQALWLWDLTEEERMRWYAFLGLDLMLAGSGALTLLVGSVGVGNLMFIRVRRRTREIGIQMAVGAKPRRILLGILAESSLLVAAGGLAGFSLAWLAAAAVRSTPLVLQVGEPRISAAVAGGTVILLGTVALLAGYFPARRAARIDPVQALAERR